MVALEELEKRSDATGFKTLKIADYAIRQIDFFSHEPLEVADQRYFTFAKKHYAQQEISFFVRYSCYEDLKKQLIELRDSKREAISADFRRIVI